MQLTLQWSQVQAVHASTTTRLVEGLLEVNLDALQALLGTDTRLQRVHLDLAHPGEACRIGRVCDVIAPRAKLEGGEDFPGVLGTLRRAGSGRTQALANMAVVVTDQQLQPPGSLALIDMSGPAAALSEFAGTHNLVLSAWPAPGVERSAYLSAMRLAGLKAAVYLAQAARACTPDRVEVFDLPASTRVPAPHRD
jgi:glycine reductase